MAGINGWIRAILVAGAALSAAACVSYPEAPRYSTRPMTTGQPPAAQPSYPAPAEAYEAPPPARAPVERIEGGALSPPVNTAPPPAYRPPPTAPARPSASVAAGAAYEIQPGDTLSGVGRRFQTPVQQLIDLNALGPRGTIAPGQRVTLPDSAVDTGPDPYATGPSPVGVLAPENSAPPPPPPPSRPVAPPPARPAPPVGTPPAPAAPLAGGLSMQWPVRGDIVRRFGPAGMGERNNGINIAASAGAPVNAAAAGRVAYVGDDLVGQGLTVLIVHREGWRTVYGHLGSATVRDGDEVRAGQQIGTVGLTAGDGRPSIHFETRHMRNDEPLAIDPLTVLPR
jgi:murein DD-endopeptidase MepM/ murein hydrolase activator NlpD